MITVTKHKRPPFTCGWRVPGLYAVETGETIEAPITGLIPCPPIPIDMQAIGLSASGMRIIERIDASGIGMGVYDVWDFVSTHDNPWPTDFIEQTRFLGTSRRLPETLTHDKHFKDLREHPWDPTLSSRHIYVHARAIIDDPAPFYADRTLLQTCPAGIEEHDKGERTWEMCAGLWWEMVGKRKKNHPQRRHMISLPRNWNELVDEWGNKLTQPSCQYYGDSLPSAVEDTVTFSTGIIMSIPLSHIEIPIDDTPDQKHNRLMGLLENGGWQYPAIFTED